MGNIPAQQKTDLDSELRLVIIRSVIYVFVVFDEIIGSLAHIFRDVDIVRCREAIEYLFEVGVDIEFDKAVLGAARPCRAVLCHFFYLPICT